MVVKILIVSGDIAVRDSMQEFIEISGYHTLSAASAEAALEVLRTNKIQIVITDIKLNDMNGLELTDKIIKDYTAEVIVMTGYSGDYSYEEAINKGASDLVFKPVRFEELLLRLKRVLKERELTLARDHMLDKMQKLATLKPTNKNTEGVGRSIEFPAEFHQAGISILSYFGTILRKKYPDKKAKIRIEQNGLMVIMTIDTEAGDREIIERALDDYGLVVTGKMALEEYTDDRILILELKNELNIAKVRIESQKELLQYQNADIESFRQLLSDSFKKSTPNINLSVSSNSNANITQDINIKDELDQISDGLRELMKDMLNDSEEDMAIQDLTDNLKVIEKCEGKREVAESSGISKIHSFLQKVENVDTTAGKIIKTAKDGIAIAQKIAVHYNQIAQWCGLPIIPKPFTKNRNDNF